MRPRWVPATLAVVVLALGTACAASGEPATPPPDPDAVRSGAAATDGALVPAVWPEVVAAGEATELVVSVAPRGEVDGPVRVEVAGHSGELVDEGGVFAGSFQVTLDQDAELVVSATVDGQPVTGSATVAVASGRLPVGPAPAPADPVTVQDPDGGEVMADRIVLRMDPDATEEHVRGAAGVVGGTVVGRLSGSTWQVDVPAVASWEELVTVLNGLQGRPGLEDVQPIGVGDLDQGVGQ